MFSHYFETLTCLNFNTILHTLYRFIANIKTQYEALFKPLPMYQGGMAHLEFEFGQE